MFRPPRGNAGAMVAGASHTGMCSMTASTSSTTLGVSKLVKFVELLVYDYLQAKGFKETGEKFAEECSNCARDRASDSRSKKCRGEDVARTVADQHNTADEASSWYYLADKLALPVRIRTQAAPVHTRAAPSTIPSHLFSIEQCRHCTYKASVHLVYICVHVQARTHTSVMNTGAFGLGG